MTAGVHWAWSQPDRGRPLPRTERAGCPILHLAEGQLQREGSGIVRCLADLKPALARHRPRAFWNANACKRGGFFTWALHKGFMPSMVFYPR